MDSDASDVRELPRISDILENTLDDAPQQSQVESLFSNEKSPGRGRPRLFPLVDLAGTSTKGDPPNKVQSLFSNEKSPGRPRGRPRKFPLVDLEGNKRPVPARKRSRKTKSRSVVSDFSVDSSSRDGSSDILELSDDDDDVLDSRAKQDSGSDPEYSEYSYTPGNRQRRKRRIPATYNERTIFMESMAVARAAREGISRKNERPRKQNSGPVKAPASGRITMTLRQMAKKHEPDRENPFLRTSGIAAIIPWPKDPRIPSPDDRVFVMKVEEQSVMQKQCGGFRRFVKSISDVVLLDLFQRVSAAYCVDGADDFVKLQQTLRFTWNSLDERVKLAWELIARRDVMVSHQKKHPEEAEIVTLDDEDVQIVTDENTKPENLGKPTETSDIDIVMEKAAENGTESGIPAENGTEKKEENGIPSVQPEVDGSVIGGDGTASGRDSGRRSEETPEVAAEEKNVPVDLRDSTSLLEPMASTSSTSPVEKDIAMTEEVLIPSADNKIVKRKKREITLTKEQMDEMPRMPFCEQTFIAGHIERVRPDRHGLSCPLCEEGTAEELYTFREIIDHVHAMHFCAHHYGCHLCGRVFTTADQLRAHPDCVGMAEYSCQKLASLTRLLEGGNAEEAMKKINFPMQCALMYLTCADCGLCLPIRSKFDQIAVRQGLYMVFQEQWRFMIRTLSLHNCESLVPFVIYMAEEPEEALDELKLPVVPSVCMKNMPLKCEKCEVEEFSTVEEIENHFLLPEHEETQRTCNAKYCGRTFGTEVFFQRHCLEQHLPKSLVFADYLTTQCRMFPPAGDLCSAPRLGAQGTSESFSDLKLPIGGVGKLSAGEVESFVEPFESTLYPKLLYAEEAKQKKLAESQEKKKKRKKDDSDDDDVFDLIRELEGPQAPMDLGYEHHGRLWLQETDAESAHRSLAARIFGEHPASRDFLSGSTTRLFNNNEMMSQLGTSGKEEECAADVKVSYELEVPHSALADSWQQAMEFTVALPVNCHMSSCDVSVLNDFLLFDERVYYCHCGTICKGVISGQHAKQCFMRAKQIVECDLDMDEHISVLYSPLWPSDNRVYCRICDESSCGISGFRFHLLSKHGMYAPFLERESPVKIPMSERALTPFYRTFSAQLADVDLGIPSNGLLNKLPEPVKEKVPSRQPTSIYAAAAARTTTGSYAPYPGAGERRTSIAVQQARAQANRFAATSTPSIWVPPARTVRRNGNVSQSCTLCAFDDLQGGFMIKAHFKQNHSFVCTSCLGMYCNGRALFEHRTSGGCSKVIEAHCINSGASSETVEVLCPLCSLAGHPERIVDHLRMQHFDKLRICKNSGIIRPAVTSIKLAPKSGQFAATRAIPAKQASQAVSAYTPQQTVNQKPSNDVQTSSEQQQGQAQVRTISHSNRTIQAKANCECIICGLYCKTPLDLKKHYTAHPEQWHVCPICYVSGNTTAFVNGAVDLARHLQKYHMKVYPRKHLKYCTACGLALTTSPTLIRKSGKADIISFLQQILHHFLFDCNKLEVCMMCNTMEDLPHKYTSEDMVVHQTATHEKNLSRFRCNQCRKYFPHRFAAEEHGCKGTMVGSYTCHCGKSFNVRLLFEDHFNAHHLTRTSQWPFVLQCSICLLQFTNQACTSHAALHYRFNGEKVASISYEDTPLQPAMIDDIISARLQDRYDSLAQGLREEAQHAMDVQQTVTKLLVEVCENMGEPVGEVVELSDDDEESETDETQVKDPLVISAKKFLRTARSTLEDEWESLRKKNKKKVNGTAKPLKQEPAEEDDCVVIDADATCASTSRSESVAVSGSASPATLVTEDSLLHLPREESDDQTAEQTAARQSERGGQYFEEDDEGQNELGDLAVLSTQNVVSIREVVDASADDELAVVAEVSHPAGTLPSVVASQQMQRDKIKCPRCSTMFFTKKSLTEHLRTAHRFDAGGTCTEELGIPLGTIIYVCRTCCVAFDSLPQLAGHMANHSSTDQQNCAKCSMISYSQQLKVIHDRAHLNGQLTFACHECKVCYTEEPELYGHLSEIHNVPMLYFCKSCNVASTKGSSIADHVAVNRCRIDRSNPLHSTSNECRMGVLPAAMLHYNPENVETHKERLRMEVVRCVEPSVCSHRSFVAAAHPMVSCGECRGLMNLQRFAAEYQSSTGQEPEFKYSNGGGSVTPPQRLALNGQGIGSRLKLNPPNTRASMQNLGRAIGLPSAAAQNRAVTARAHAQVRRGNQIYQATKVVLPPSVGTPPDIAPRNTVTQSTGLALIQQADHVRHNLIGIKRKTNLQSYVRDERDRTSEEPEVLEVESTISDSGPSTSTAPPTLRPQAKQPAEVIDLSDDEDDDDDDIIVEESTPAVVLPKKTIRRGNSVNNGKSTENNEIGKPCNFCSRTIPTERMLIMHSLHTNGHKYVCLDCPVTVADEQEAVEHYYREHVKRAIAKLGNSFRPLSVKVACPIRACDKIFESLSGLRTHLAQHELPHASQYCSTRFYSKETCCAHEESHREMELSGAPDANCCLLCGTLDAWQKRLPDLGQLITHTAMHGFRRFFLCRECSICFKGDAEGHKFLRHYESQHTTVDGETAGHLLCTVCDERFPREEMSSHAREKHFVTGFKRHTDAVEGQLIVKTGSQMRIMLGMEKIYGEGDGSDID